MPFFVLLVIVLAPFALFFSLVRVPFAKRRIAKLNEIITSDWLPRKKYIYLNYDDDFPLVEFVERSLILKYGNHLIFDKWSAIDSEWIKNEPDTYHRVTAIQQDIAGDFDGDSHLLVAVLTPEKARLTEDMANVLYFNQSIDGYVDLRGEDIAVEEAKKRISSEIEAGLHQWENV